MELFSHEINSIDRVSLLLPTYFAMKLIQNALLFFFLELFCHEIKSL